MTTPVEVLLRFNDLASAAHLLNLMAGSGIQAGVSVAAQPGKPAPGNGTVAHTAVQPTTPPPPTASAAGTPPVPTASSPSSVQHTVETVTPVGQQFMKTFKAAGMKQAFAKHGYEPQLTSLDANGLNIMHDYMTRSLAAGQML